MIVIIPNNIYMDGNEAIDKYLFNIMNKYKAYNNIKLLLIIDKNKFKHDYELVYDKYDNIYSYLDDMEYN